MWTISAEDRYILRELARRVREVASQPRMEALRKKWVAHNDFQTDEPMVLFELGGIQNMVVPDSELKCVGQDARQMERMLKLRLFQAEKVRDDLVIDADLCINWQIQQHGWRNKAHDQHGKVEGGVQEGYVPIPVLSDPEEIYQMQPTTYTVLREESGKTLAFWENVLGDILNVRLRGNYWWTLGMTWDFLRLTGMETFLTLPYDDPDAFHAIMSFLEKDAENFIDFLEKESLFTLNNGNDYVGSGTCGFTHKLPGDDFDGQVKAHNLWVLMESQESVSMSPSMFKEFIFPYQKRLAERFGLCYYGCCEPLHNRFDAVAQLRNLHTVSVSPWCDMARLAEQLEKDRPLVLACKPSPALISAGFEEEPLKDHTRQALHYFKGRPVELVMKDVHTVEHDLSRCGRWVDLVRACF